LALFEDSKASYSRQPRVGEAASRKNKFALTVQTFCAVLDEMRNRLVEGKLLPVF
jgi:hypothetical protein